MKKFFIAEFSIVFSISLLMILIPRAKAQTANIETPADFASSCPSNGYSWIEPVYMCTIGGACTFDSQCGAGLACNLSGLGCSCGASSGGETGSCCQASYGNHWFSSLESANGLASCIGNGAKVQKYYNPGPIWDWFDPKKDYSETWQYELSFPSGCKQNAGMLADAFQRYAKGQPQYQGTLDNLYYCIKTGEYAPPSSPTTPTAPSTPTTPTTPGGTPAQTWEFNKSLFNILTQMTNQTKLVLQNSGPTPAGSVTPAVNITNSQYVTQVLNLIKTLVNVMTNYLNLQKTAP